MAECTSGTTARSLSGLIWQASRTDGGAPMRDSSRCSSGPGGGKLSPPAITSTRQVEQRPRPPQTEACGMPPQRLASRTL
jgi:hypothetical protein